MEKQEETVFDKARELFVVVPPSVFFMDIFDFMEEKYRDDFCVRKWSVQQLTEFITNFGRIAGNLDKTVTKLFPDEMKPDRIIREVKGFLLEKYPVFRTDCNDLNWRFYETVINEFSEEAARTEKMPGEGDHECNRRIVKKIINRCRKIESFDSEKLVMKAKEKVLKYQKEFPEKFSNWSFSFYGIEDIFFLPNEKNRIFVLVSDLNGNNADFELKKFLSFGPKKFYEVFFKKVNTNL